MDVDVEQRRRILLSGERWCLAACALLVLAACSGTSGRRPQAVPPVPSATAAQAAPAQIQRLEAVDRDPGVEIDVVADRALVWTTYRDRDGNLVIELPNTVPGPELGDLSRTRGLIRAIDVERLADAERPLTRLVVRTREDSEHSLTTSGTTLRLELYPAGFTPPAKVARETPKPMDARPDAPEQTAAAPAMAAEVPSAAAYATPEHRVSGPPVTGVAASRLIRVEVMGADEGTVIRVVGDGEFAYTTFRLENPDRFVLDLDGVINTSLRSTVTVGGDVVDQVRIGQFKPRPDAVSRVVFDLRRFAVPQIERGPDGLMIRFVEVAPPPMIAETPPEPAMPEPAMPEPIEEDLPAVETVIAEQPMAEEPAPPAAAPPRAPPAEILPPVVEEPEPEPPVIAAAPPPVVEMPPAAPPPPMEMPEEELVEETVEEVPVVVVEVPREELAPAPPPPLPPPVRPAPPTPTDAVRFEAQQIAVDPAPAPAQQSRVPPSFQSLVVSSQQRTYVGDPISMSLKNADLVETLRSFSRISDLNFVIQPGVQGSVTVELDGVPWDQALEQILKIHELGMDIDGTIVRIAKLADLRKEAEERRQLALIRQQTVPMRTVMRSLSYARAQEIAQLLQARSAPGVGLRGQSSGILSSRGTVQVDQRTNTLIIRELPEVIDTVLAVIANLDTPEPQVKIEARIVEATKSFSRSLGIRWNFTGVASNEFGNSTGIEFPNNIDANGGVNLLTGGDQGFLNLSLGNVLNSFTLDASLIAAENEGLINVVSAPSIMTLNNEQAVIQSGIQIPIQTVANDTVTVQFVNATLQLQVEPQVTAEGTILMDINVTKKEPQPALLVVGATNAPIATREAQTRVIVRDGGTAVIGGIYEVSNNQSQDRIPGLANVPILKHLFRNRSRENRNQELLIFVTPRIIRM